MRNMEGDEANDNPVGFLDKKISEKKLIFSLWHAPKDSNPDRMALEASRLPLQQGHIKKLRPPEKNRKAGGRKLYNNRQKTERK